jgi:hypothetical protein
MKANFIDRLIDRLAKVKVPSWVWFLLLGAVVALIILKDFVWA